MSEGYVVEIEGDIVGIVVRQPGEHGFRFHASIRDFDAMDGAVFANPTAAQRAAHEHADVRRGRDARRADEAAKRKPSRCSAHRHVTAGSVRSSGARTAEGARRIRSGSQVANSDRRRFAWR
jgi:hypothetical protein